MCLDVLESAGNTEGFRLKPLLLSARTSPLSLQGEGWGEGTDFDLALEQGLTPIVREQELGAPLAPTKSPSAQGLSDFNG